MSNEISKKGRLQQGKLGYIQIFLFKKEGTIMGKTITSERVINKSSQSSRNKLLNPGTGIWVNRGGDLKEKSLSIRCLQTTETQKETKREGTCDISSSITTKERGLELSSFTSCFMFPRTKHLWTRVNNRSPEKQEVGYSKNFKSLLGVWNSKALYVMWVPTLNHSFCFLCNCSQIEQHF